MGTSRTVTNEQIEQVIRLREQEGMIFEAISEAMGWSRPLRASDIYHYYKGARRPLIGAVTIRTPKSEDADAPIGGPGSVPDRVCADQAITRADAPPPSPNAKRYLSSIADDIALRIQLQGITAGLLGDPPAGRSALDRKQEEEMGLTTSVRMRQSSVREQGAR